MSESDADPDSGSADRPTAADGTGPDGTPPTDRTPTEWVRWFLTTDHGAVSYVREVLSSVLAVMLVGLVLFAVSGLWPPMVAVESPSMKPNLNTGDLVFVMEEHRLAGAAAYGDTGVVTQRTGSEVGYRKFGMGGDVIVYQPNGNAVQTPIIHRAMFHVNESENWYDKAVDVDPEAVGAFDGCGEMPFCPAPHAGFITKGDNERTNRQYDQVSGLSAPVRPGWVVGTAEFRIPLLGNIRLWASGAGLVSGAPGDGTVSETVGTDGTSVVPTWARDDPAPVGPVVAPGAEGGAAPENASVAAGAAVG